MVARVLLVALAWLVAVVADGTARRTYDADEAFARLGIPRSTGFDLIKRGQFPVPVIRAGRRLYIPKEPLDRLLTGRPAVGDDASDVAAPTGDPDDGERLDKLLTCAS
jgi:hypothetical protein